MLKYIVVKFHIFTWSINHTVSNWKWGRWKFVWVYVKHLLFSIPFSPSWNMMSKRESSQNSKWSNKYDLGGPISQIQYNIFKSQQWHWFLACRSRQASIVLERYFLFDISLLSILFMLIARMEKGTSRVSGDSDIIT